VRKHLKSLLIDDVPTGIRSSSLPTTSLELHS